MHVHVMARLVSLLEVFWPHVPLATTAMIAACCVMSEITAASFCCLFTEGSLALEHLVYLIFPIADHQTGTGDVATRSSSKNWRLAPQHYTDCGLPRT